LSCSREECGILLLHGGIFGAGNCQAPAARRRSCAHRCHSELAIEQPITSPLDENTREGDDHLARLFLVFWTATGQDRRMEIIWGNKLKAGTTNISEGFPHYVADGSNENIRQRRSEEVDLREIYRHTWPDGVPAHRIDIAIFCDSDETHGHTVRYFAD
jgi:hypothetical protein